jgi:hypothetical protein
MKTKRFFLAAALACTAGSAYIGCANSGARNAKSAGETVLNLQDTSGGGVVWTDTSAGVPSNCWGGGFWASTYDSTGNAVLRFGDFVFTHYSGFDKYSYWGGFTFGTNGDSLCYSSYCRASLSPCKGTGSEDWVHNQWGVMAGGGLDTVAPYATVKGTPYLVAYGSGVKVWLQDSALFYPLGVYICNHPWPYYGNIYGDGFARALDQPGDYFVLKIIGLDARGYITGDTIIDTLAKYNPADPSKPIQPKGWHEVNLSDIGQGVQALRFTLETTDVGEWGPNTAFYFCMDKLAVEAEGSVAKKTAAKKTAVQKPEADVEEFADHLTVGSHVGGEAVLYNAQGQVALKTTLKTGSNKFDTKKLSAGKYTMVHHHRVKHFVKNK